jgi:RNA polymerase sigma-32 factor
MRFQEIVEPVSSGQATDTIECYDPLSAYLREISKYPLMTKEEERETALRIRTNGDKEAAQKMVLANLRLVVKTAIDYHSHLNLLDLIQEGNMGLVRAVGKYDPGRGTRFSTYASFWIRAYMLKYVMDMWSMVKIGTKDSQRKLFYSLKRERERLERAGITPSASVLAEKLDTSATEIEDMELRLCNGDISLETPQHGDGEPLIDTIRSDEDIEETLIRKDHEEMLRKKLADFKKLLSEKERFILDNRIMAEFPLTLREIGKRFKTSRESVRQIQVKVSKNLMKNLTATGATTGARVAPSTGRARGASPS